MLLANRAALLKFLMMRQVPPDDAEDLLQDMFVKLASQPLGPVSQPRAYLYRMADNLLLDRRFSDAHRLSREQAWAAAQTGPSPDADDRPSPERALLARERLAIVAAALAMLPDRTIAIFRRFRIDGAAQKEIAAELGISVSAVEKHLHRAYQVVVEAQDRFDADRPAPHRRQ